jgi:membrane protease YdiL (CAAX protease family)
MPAVVLASVAVSVAFGGSADQLRPAAGFSFSVGATPVLAVLLLAATFEELGWRTYAVQSLNERLGDTVGTLVFGLLWAVWHLPLYLINGYYQQEITKQSPWYGVNFVISVIPMAFIIGWLCRLNRGSVPIAIGFHFFVNLCQEALQITQPTKCIETAVLVLVAAVIALTGQHRGTARPCTSVPSNGPQTRIARSTLPSRCDGPLERI